MARDYENLYEYEEKNYYKPVTVSNVSSNIYIECESNSDRNKTLSVENILINSEHI